MGTLEISSMTTATKLKARTIKDLAAMAKKKKVSGWHAMRKDELVKALVNHARTAAARAAQRTRVNGQIKKNPAAQSVVSKAIDANKRPDRTGRKVFNPGVQRRLNKINSKLAQAKDLAAKLDNEQNGCKKDRLVVMVRDPYWLHVYWELTRTSIQRAKATLGQYWHTARPILRLYEVSRNGTTTSARKLLQDITIHGGVSNWYIDVQDPPKSFQIEIGYLGTNEKFSSLARSNIVSTPRAGAGDSFDKNWAEVAKDFDRIYAMSGGYADNQSNRELREVFETRLRRPMGDPMTTRYGRGAAGAGTKSHEFNFEVDTELIVHGVTDPNAHVTLRGEPIHLRNDGTFAVRFSLPESRHVLPVVASSGDGAQQRTIVLAIDRNTKVMELVIRDPGE